jgi:hypothetical protein
MVHEVFAMMCGRVVLARPVWLLLLALAFACAGRGKPPPRLGPEPAETMDDSKIAEYIPKDLADSHRRLMEILPERTIAEMKQGTEHDMIRFHHGLGTALRNGWGPWQGSRLATHLQKLGLYHPDDMSVVILATFWCRLHHRPYRVAERVAEFEEYWRSQAEPRGTSPADGARIVWVITLDRRKGTVHLGLSVSDRSCWRFEYGSDRSIEPARPDEIRQLRELEQTWKRLGTHVSGLPDS